jgi:hypothetical protein
VPSLFIIHFLSCHYSFSFIFYYLNYLFVISFIHFHYLALNIFFILFSVGIFFFIHSFFFSFFSRSSLYLFNTSSVSPRSLSVYVPHFLHSMFLLSSVSVSLIVCMNISVSLVSMNISVSLVSFFSQQCPHYFVIIILMFFLPVFFSKFVLISLFST